MYNDVFWWPVLTHGWLIRKCERWLTMLARCRHKVSDSSALFWSVRKQVEAGGDKKISIKYTTIAMLCNDSVVSIFITAVPLAMTFAHYYVHGFSPWPSQTLLALLCLLQIGLSGLKKQGETISSAVLCRLPPFIWWGPNAKLKLYLGE